MAVEGTKKTRLGRRSRRHTPMPHSSFTAYVETHVFFLLMGDGETSKGVEKTAREYAKTGEGKGVMSRANTIVALVREHLSLQAGIPGDEVSQQEILQHIKGDFWKYEEQVR